MNLDLQVLMTNYKVICNNLIQGMPTIDYKELNNYENFKSFFSSEEFNEIIRAKHNRQAKRCRTKKKFKEMYKLYLGLQAKNGHLFFGTVTLNDEYLLHKKEETRVKIINKWLKSHFIYAIVNKDFGSKTEREHYHFLGITLENYVPVLNEKGEQVKGKSGILMWNLEKQDYKIGFEPNLEMVNLDKYDFDKTINYLLKLNNHSNKLGTKSRIRVIKNKQLITYEKITKICDDNYKKVLFRKPCTES